jgi:hypothetical protein
MIPGTWRGCLAVLPWYGPLLALTLFGIGIILGPHFIPGHDGTTVLITSTTEARSYQGFISWWNRR